MALAAICRPCGEGAGAGLLAFPCVCFVCAASRYSGSALEKCTNRQSISTAHERPIGLNRMVPPTGNVNGKWEKVWPILVPKCPTRENRNHVLKSYGGVRKPL